MAKQASEHIPTSGWNFAEICVMNSSKPAKERSHRVCYSSVRMRSSWKNISNYHMQGKPWNHQHFCKCPFASCQSECQLSRCPTFFMFFFSRKSFDLYTTQRLYRKKRLCREGRLDRISLNSTRRSPRATQRIGAWFSPSLSESQTGRKRICGPYDLSKSNVQFTHLWINVSKCAYKNNWKGRKQWRKTGFAGRQKRESWTTAQRNANPMHRGFWVGKNWQNLQMFADFVGTRVAEVE